MRGFRPHKVKTKKLEIKPQSGKSHYSVEEFHATKKYRKKRNV